MHHSLKVRAVALDARHRGFTAKPPAEGHQYGAWVRENSWRVFHALRHNGIYCYLQRRGRSALGKEVPPAIWVADRSVVLTRIGFSDPPPVRTLVGEQLEQALDYLIEGKTMGKVLNAQEQWAALFAQPVVAERATPAWSYIRNR